MLREFSIDIWGNFFFLPKRDGKPWLWVQIQGFKCNGLRHPRKRERIFVISYLGKNQFNFENLQKKNPRNIQEFIDKEVSEIYEVKQESILNFLRGKPNHLNFKGRLKVIDSFAYTICTKQVRAPNLGIFEIGNGKYRYLTERECLRLMGIEDRMCIFWKRHTQEERIAWAVSYTSKLEIQW